MLLGPAGDSGITDGEGRGPPGERAGRGWEKWVKEEYSQPGKSINGLFLYSLYLSRKLISTWQESLRNLSIEQSKWDILIKDGSCYKWSPEPVTGEAASDLASDKPG